MKSAFQKGLGILARSVSAARAHFRHGPDAGSGVPGTARLTFNDLKRLRALLAAAARAGALAAPRSSWLEQRIETATLFLPEHYPPDAISINSRVRFLDETTGATHEYALVFPAEASVFSGRISILSPVGSALLGRSVGDRVHCRTPGGEGTLRILSLEYQPEAAGRY